MNDAELVGALLERIDALNLSNMEAGEAVGLSHEQIRKYRKGQWERLTASTKRKIERYLRGGAAVEGRGFAEGVRYALERMEEVVEELRGVFAATGSESDAWSSSFPNLPPIAATLIRLSQAERPDLGPYAGAREALALEMQLRDSDRLDQIDEAIWRAYQMGRIDVPWERLEPAEGPWDLTQLPFGPLTQRVAEGSLQQG